MKVELTKEFFLEAAHRNPAGGEASSRLHGHSYRVEIVAEGEVHSHLDWLIDYGEITGRFRPLYTQLDHHYLNEVEGMPHAGLQGVRDWILERFAPGFECLKDVRVSIVGDCDFKPVELAASPEHDLPARLRFTFEAAQYLAKLPPNHKCSSLHGHSYRIEAAGPDLEALREPLRGVYDALDHRCLNDVAGLENATSEILCAWMWERLSKRPDDVTFISVSETNTARCVYRGE